LPLPAVSPGAVIDTILTTNRVPTFWITLLFGNFGIFGIFGFIPAVNHSNEARRVGKPTNQYGLTSGLTMAGSFLVWIIAFAVLAAGVPTYNY